MEKTMKRIKYVIAASLGLAIAASSFAGDPAHKQIPAGSVFPVEASTGLDISLVQNPGSPMPITFTVGNVGKGLSNCKLLAGATVDFSTSRIFTQPEKLVCTSAGQTKEMSVKGYITGIDR